MQHRLRLYFTTLAGSVSAAVGQRQIFRNPLANPQLSHPPPSAASIVFGGIDAAEKCSQSAHRVLKRSQVGVYQPRRAVGKACAALQAWALPCSFSFFFTDTIRSCRGALTGSTYFK